MSAAVRYARRMRSANVHRNKAIAERVAWRFSRRDKPFTTLMQRLQLHDSTSTATVVRHEVTVTQHTSGRWPADPFIHRGLSAAARTQVGRL